MCISLDKAMFLSNGDTICLYLTSIYDDDDDDDDNNNIHNEMNFE